ncbi:hypothetical protein GOP47_0009009 [Adiantum capillus-veneris]|uniref:Uncharacterized protein n=1 Tax=Adiantum capillus-veneris TaxID=13818 RepID=A0A9D4ZIP3_ADICA|nr:hypothetical protein GOP47_0009009 [Adiantum capillus-veneris]
MMWRGQLSSAPARSHAAAEAIVGACEHLGSRKPTAATTSSPSSSSSSPSTTTAAATASSAIARTIPSTASIATSEESLHAHRGAMQARAGAFAAHASLADCELSEGLAGLLRFAGALYLAGSLLKHIVAVETGCRLQTLRLQISLHSKRRQYKQQSAQRPEEEMGRVCSRSSHICEDER